MCIFHWYKQIDQIRKLSKRYREPLCLSWEQSVCQEMACCFIMTDTWYDWVVFIIPYLLKEKIGSLKNWMLFPYSQKREKGNKLKILLGWQEKRSLLGKIDPSLIISTFRIEILNVKEWKDSKDGCVILKEN